MGLGFRKPGGAGGVGRERGCVVGDNTGLEFREVASKGPLDALIRELCKIT